MVSLEHYANREQAYVKHVFLERYLEALAFKTASAFNHIVYVDGFAGPWQSANEQFGDTSFGIALNALRRAKNTWKVNTGRTVRMTALLVEQNASAYAKLATIHERYPDIQIKTYHADFIDVAPMLLRDIPTDAFTFFLLDPKGWRIPLLKLTPLLARQKSEVIFNFMFDFINRAANIADANVVKGLDELMPYGGWKARFAGAEPIASITATPDERKTILVGAFKESLRQIGGYEYVADTTVLRPLSDRTLYCLIYATRHESGIAAFRECQINALKAQETTRAAVKMQHATRSTGQTEFFQSLHDMRPDETAAYLEGQRQEASQAVMEIVPKAPEHITYRKLWAAVLSQIVVRVTDVNAICAAKSKSGELVFPDWEPRRKVPQDHYRVQQP
jgi:three-Cys-motif partner protein